MPARRAPSAYIIIIISSMTRGAFLGLPPCEKLQRQQSLEIFIAHFERKQIPPNDPRVYFFAAVWVAAYRSKCTKVVSIAHPVVARKP